MVPVVLLFILLAGADANLKIISSVTTLEDFNEPLTITCNFSYSGFTDMVSLVSLTLSKRENKANSSFQDLISINSYNPNHVEQDIDFLDGASGLIQPNGSYSWLQAEYLNPTPDDSGQYKCESHGIDHFGHSLRMERTVTIRDNMVDPDDLQAKLEELQKKLNASNARIEELLIAQKETERRCEETNAYWFNLYKNLTFGNDPSIIAVSDLFNSSSYYLLVQPTATFDDADKTCVRNGGYLLEVNSEEEFQFLEDAFNNTQDDFQLPPGKDLIVTGASYPALAAPFEFYTNKGDPMYLGHWASGEPTRDKVDHNWLLLEILGGELYMADGIREHARIAYLCEVSPN